VFSSEGERFLHTEEVTGSIPVTPTKRNNDPGFARVFHWKKAFSVTFGSNVLKFQRLKKAGLEKELFL
jgi:hypothetical protein